ncbi:aminotransferase class I/II-fold pyridoxal phosphate-dependent enzyme [Fodinibacter luteus]|uniref:Aminotransferase n=1 Tax=Fodinibacter luteus TaxID=552064 RepID=A0ABP8JYZ1_9MICO
MRIAPNLALDERVNVLRSSGVDVLHLGFGEAGLPVHPGLVDALGAGSASNAYGPVAGAQAPRAAVAGYWTRRGTPTDAEQVVLAPGSKPLLAAVVACEPGDVVLPRPSWVTYASQVELFGRRTVWVDRPLGSGGIPDPALLPAALARARAEGATPRLVVATLPDNPTGLLARPDEVEALCRVAEAEDLVVISDEIYRDVVFGSVPFVSPADLVPDRTITVTGLSKSLALGGWRVGAVRFPDTAWGRALRGRVVGFASQVWSNLAAPMQAVAEYAFDEPADLVRHREASTRLHGLVVDAVHRIFARHGVVDVPPDGAFYVYPDFEPHRERLARHGIRDGSDLARWLLETHGLAVLEGEAFGDDPHALRFRAATSLLYGDTARRRSQALESADPLGVPHVARSLDRLDAVVAAATSA